jgi:hypothetical protein
MILLNSCGLRFGNYEAYQHHKMKLCVNNQEVVAGTNGGLDWISSLAIYSVEVFTRRR